MLNFIKPNFIKERINSENEKCKSIQLMLEKFNSETLGEPNKRNLERDKFMKLYSKFSELRSDLDFYDDSGYFGKYRQFSHAVEWAIIDSAEEEIKKMIRAKKWDWEFVEGCIEDVEVEIELLKDNSYDEIFPESN